MDDRAQAYLAALSNPKRMSIVKALHEKPLTFTQLLAGTGIEDSSLLNFHLKKLQDLVERREGFYCLTEEGTRVLEILSSLKEPVKERSMDVMQPTPLGRGTSERPCSDCGRKIDVLADLCPYCHSRQVRKVVSSLWYLVPVFLLWVGGLVAWFVNKDIDPRCARRILIFGFVWTPIAVALFLLALLLI